MAGAITRARPTRAQETRRQRRMRPGSLEQSGVKLAVNESQLDRNTYEYRWVKAGSSRVKQLQARDWDIVNDDIKEDSDGLGIVPTKVGGLGESGQPYDMVVMRKYKDWYQDDQKAKMKPLDQFDEELRRGSTTTKATDPGMAGANTYTPNGRNTIGRA